MSLSPTQIATCIELLQQLEPGFLPPGNFVDSEKLSLAQLQSAILQL